jgi:hypothetical protein
MVPPVVFAVIAGVERGRIVAIRFHIIMPCQARWESTRSRFPASHPARHLGSLLSEDPGCALQATRTAGVFSILLSYHRPGFETRRNKRGLIIRAHLQFLERFVGDVFGGRSRFRVLAQWCLEARLDDICGARRARKEVRRDCPFPHKVEVRWENRIR